jgi:adenylosuccinate synthase
MNNVDVVVGGQFGDEGKGQICAHLAYKQMVTGDPYGFSVRVGGSNAEHRFATPDGTRHTGRVLPCAGWVDRDTKLVLGAGHMIKLNSFFSEVKELTGMFGDQTGRIFIDPQAGVIDSLHVGAGEHTAWRGSTHQGNGQAVACKVLRDGTFRVARDYPELKDFVKPNTVETMKYWMDLGEIGLVEGSQGALLSLNHGYYPFCTSKDVTPAAILGEAGIPTRRVRDTYAVYRTVFMRVPGNSGPSAGRELSWEELEAAIGKAIGDDVKVQTDSPTGARERMFLWSWEEFEKSVALIGPTRMALTFADWWSTSFSGMSLRELINGMELRAGCKVAILRDGPSWSSHILS